MVSPGQPRVCVYAGSDRHSRRAAVETRITAVLQGASRDCDLQIFRGGDAAAHRIIDHLSTVPFLAPARIALVRDFDDLPDEAITSLIAYARKPASGACLILESDDPAAAKAFAGIPAVTTRLFAEPAGAERGAWIRQYVGSRGKKVEPAAVLALGEAAPGDVGLLVQELEKLIAYTGQRPSIGAADVEEVVGPSLVASVFDLTGAIEEERIDDALRVVRELLRGGKKHYEIIGLLAWHAKRLLRAKTLQIKGATDAYIASSLRLHRKYGGRFLAQVRSLGLDAIRDRMRALLEADLDIKRSRLDPALALECAVLRLCLSGS